MHRRTVLHRSTHGAFGETSLDEDSQNRVLQKAISLYLHSKVKLQLVTAETTLTATDGKGALTRRSRYGCYGECDEDESCRTVAGILSQYKIIQSPPKGEWHLIRHSGQEQSRLELKISYNREYDRIDKPTITSTTAFEFQSTDGTAIDNFIDAAYNWYLGELKRMEDNSRYLYELELTSGASADNSNDDEGNSSGNLYKRYRLSDEKTFDSLFFKHKRSLLSLIDNFQQRKGRYSIKGYPHKLGLLLFGPPGSGKTSLIKALAHYTGRSVINVPLSRIKTNAELMSIFYGSSIRVQDEYVPVQLRFRDVIFVVEDVDASSNIVKRRDGRKTGGAVQTERFEVQATKPLWHMLLESRNDSCRSLVKELMEKSERLKSEASKSGVVLAVAERMMVFPGISVIGEAIENPILKRIGDEAVNSAREFMDQYDTVNSFLGAHAETIKTMLDSGAQVDVPLEDALLGISSPKSFPPPLTSQFREREVSYTKYNGERDEVHLEELTPTGNSGAAISSATQSPANRKAIGPSIPVKGVLDELNLQGILNVLDGVVDAPGRIVIMTTNHPEQLDPALIRPGRIDKKLLLGYMEALDMMHMLEHYFQTILTNEQRQRIDRAVSGIPRETQSRLCLTPAQIEQMTAEHEDVEDMIIALEKKGQSLVPRSKNRFPAATKSALTYDS
jgi:SpoVK/Ycf46/Vps4 family AAA+-type ATPase